MKKRRRKFKYVKYIVLNILKTKYTSVKERANNYKLNLLFWLALHDYAAKNIFVRRTKTLLRAGL